MEYEELETSRSFSKRAITYLTALWIAAGTLGFYAFHEHRLAQSRSEQNQQVTAELSSTRQQVDDLSAKVNALVAARAQPPQQAQAQAAPEQSQSEPAPHPQVRHLTAPSHHSDASRWKKMQSQLDAQNQAIQDTRSQLTSTQGDLVNTRTELTGSIARTHDELVVLQRKGERSYYEFDLDKSKSFQHDGPFGVRLRKANSKHQYADLELLVDDRSLSQKHVNLYQPVMFYTPDSPQPVELVINSISKDHIHGYVSAPKYRQSELASMSNANANANPNAHATATAANNQGGSDATPPQRQKLPPPQ